MLDCIGSGFCRAEPMLGLRAQRGVSAYGAKSSRAWARLYSSAVPLRNPLNTDSAANPTPPSSTPKYVTVATRKA